MLAGTPDILRMELLAASSGVTIDAVSTSSLGGSTMAGRASDYAKSEVQRSMSRRSGVSVACPLCRAPSKVALPTEMHTSVP